MSEKRTDVGVYCDGYPLSTFEQLVAEATSQTNLIKDMYNNIILGITPEIFSLINKLQNDINNIQNVVNDLQLKYGNEDTL